ncbi:Acyl-CoA synthetase short-chain family member 3 mitochondrial [Dissostichus eleginoides]|uniref:Acyl-CoA synthetase short-chain family member 3 mitochondrial n=1 Tax=Dissostichus eleginoides TaxID=100907 RepID=A0AAD9BKI1_DISEL|nr:Acyl-CoA synthetase short-chain family member 3 mitochondrial [Dissostichus eleginoides]
MVQMTMQQNILYIFRSGDQETYSSARANLRRGIAQAKYCYKQRIEEHFSSSDPRRMWQGIQTLTNYKSLRNMPPTSSASFPEELNHFYARFDRENKEIPIKFDLPPDEPPLTLSISDVYSTLSKLFKPIVSQLSANQLPVDPSVEQKLSWNTVKDSFD